MSEGKAGHRKERGCPLPQQTAADACDSECSRKSSRWLNKRWDSEGWRRLPSVLESVFSCCASDYEVAGRCHFGHLGTARAECDIRWQPQDGRTRAILRASANGTLRGRDAAWLCGTATGVSGGNGRKVKRKGRQAGMAYDLDPATMQLHDGSYDGETQPHVFRRPLPRSCRR